MITLHIILVDTTMRGMFGNKWFWEVTLMLFSFVLFTLNDWILIAGWKSFFLGVLYFLVLYLHAQCNRYLLLPIFLKQNNLLAYILLSAVLLLIFTGVLHLLTTNGYYQSCFLYKNISHSSIHNQFGILLGSSICILGTIQFLEQYQFQQEKSQSELLSNQMQIDYLKKQLNPHFLFNTLNTVYGISLKFPERTSEMILKLSQLLRYQIDNHKKEYVSIKEEIEFIGSYIELEKERVSHRSRIEFVFPKSVEEQYRIAPMLLINYVENAFKHGTNSMEDSFIKIILTLHEGKLNLEVTNSLPKKKQSIHSSQIGLENTKARLDYFYPKKHQLMISSNLTAYQVKLNINLS